MPNSPEDRPERPERRDSRPNSGGDRGGFRSSGPRRDGDRPTGGFRRDDRRDDGPRGPRREDDRGGYRPRDDRPAGGRPSGGGSGGGRPTGGRPTGGGFRPRDDRPRQDRPRDDRSSGGGGGFRPREDRPRFDRPRDDRPGGGGGGFRPRDDRPRDDRPSGGGFRPREDRPRDDRRDERPRDDRPRFDGPRDDRPRGPRREDDRGGYRPRDEQRSDRRDDRPRGPRRDDDRDRGPSRRPVVEGRGRFENRDRDDRREEREPVKRLPIPDEVTGHEIDPSVRQELMSLPKTLAEDVARNLVMVARLLDEEPEQAYAYSRVALRLASRVAAVREAAGFASYASERYAEALAEFRATRRMTGTVDLWPVMADCERGLGRPERALEMAGAPEVHKLDKAGQVEMRLVAAGARQDMGQAEAAVVTLQSSELASNAVHPWTARLRYAYADALLLVGREREARDWFAKALEADQNGTTDASDRLAQLDGVEFVDASDEDEEPAPGKHAEPSARPEPQDTADDDVSDDDSDVSDEDDDEDDDEDEDASDDDQADADDEPASPAPSDAATAADAPAKDSADHVAEDETAADDADDAEGKAVPSSFLDSPFREPAQGERKSDDQD